MSCNDGPTTSAGGCHDCKPSLSRPPSTTGSGAATTKAANRRDWKNNMSVNRGVTKKKKTAADEKQMKLYEYSAVYDKLSKQQNESEDPRA